jgi:hypothetical protein
MHHRRTAEVRRDIGDRGVAAEGLDRVDDLRRTVDTSAVNAALFSSTPPGVRLCAIGWVAVC